jgi:hypothetical protein
MQLAPVESALEGLAFQPQSTCDPLPELLPMRGGSLERAGAHLLASRPRDLCRFPRTRGARTFRYRPRSGPELLHREGWLL